MQLMHPNLIGHGASVSAIRSTFSPTEVLPGNGYGKVGFPLNSLLALLPLEVRLLSAPLRLEVPFSCSPGRVS